MRQRIMGGNWGLFYVESGTLSGEGGLWSRVLNEVRRNPQGGLGEVCGRGRKDSNRANTYNAYWVRHHVLVLYMY